MHYPTTLQLSNGDVVQARSAPAEPVEASHRLREQSRRTLVPPDRRDIVEAATDWSASTVVSVPMHAATRGDLGPAVRTAPPWCTAARRAERNVVLWTEPRCRESQQCVRRPGAIARLGNHKRITTVEPCAMPTDRRAARPAPDVQDAARVVRCAVMVRKYQTDWVLAGAARGGLGDTD